MEYRLGKKEDIDEICNLISSAIKTMENQGIHQWDDLYPTRDDFSADIQDKTLYVAMEHDRIVAIYVISRECDPEYLNGTWKYLGETACILHRLCVSPNMQNRGVGKEILAHVEKQLAGMGFASIRLDVFSQNPYAIKLYENDGYEKRGYADWRMGRFWLMEKKI